MLGGIHHREPLHRLSSSYRVDTPHVTCAINPNHSTHPIISSIRSARSSFALPSSHRSNPLLPHTFTCPICKHHHHHHRTSHTRTLSTTGGNGDNNNNNSNNNNGGGGNNNDDNNNYDSNPSSSSSSAAAATASYVAVQPPTFVLEDIILLDVTGMRCAGCVSRVKSLLEAEPSVTSASVNIATETAMVKVRLPPPAVDVELGQGKNSIPPSLSKPNQSPLALLGTSLATMLTNHGYAAAARPLDSYGSASGKIAASKREERIRKLKEATKKLAVAWILASACLAHHVTHWFGLHLPANLSWLGATSTHAGLSALALIGPGRDIVVEGFRSLWRGAPDMNSLVAMGASAAFGISAVAAGFPALGWRTFFEEPAMLLGVVLVGRALEERAKLAAGSDMAALQTLLPSKARLRIRLEQGGEAKGDDTANKNNSYKGNSSKSPSPSSSWKEVPAEALAAGDVVVVLPGDRLPTDGIVVGGKSTVDESALTGEPLPVKKQLGDAVNAGTVNVDGRLEVETTAAGADTAVADVAQLVEAAQARSAPVQRLADAVAGKFTYGVMAAAAATFLFWATAGPRLFPQVVAKAASSASSSSAATAVITPTINAGLALALQLACNVLVVACPCALGLAAPTAVLVGTSVGAKRGLLIRGGDILEAASRVDTVVFDKTGTLTCGRPIVVDVTLTSCVTDTTTTDSNAGDGDGYGHKKQSKNSSNRDGKKWSRDELMQLAAAVEIESTHPIAKAIVASSSLVVGDGDRHRHGMNLLVEPGTFQQEPGSGVTAIIDNNQVSVGTIEWVASSYYIYKDTTESSSSNSSSNSSSSSSSNTILNNIIKQGPSKPGHIQVFLGINGHIEAVIEISDETRPEAARAIAALKAMGLDVAMISGDQRSTAEAVASSLGIPAANVYAQVKPAGKAAIIENLQRDTTTAAAAAAGGEGGGEDGSTIIGALTNLVGSRSSSGSNSSSCSQKIKGRVVAMVGDGVNDAAALVTARVGIAMGGGVAAAAEVADVVLLGDKLAQVVDTFKLSRATFGKIKQNLWWAFAYNLIGIPLAAGAALPVAGLALTPSLSGAMMGLSSLAVMANSLTLQLYGRDEKNVVETWRGEEKKRE